MFLFIDFSFARKVDSESRLGIRGQTVRISGRRDNLPVFPKEAGNKGEPDMGVTSACGRWGTYPLGVFVPLE